jgi:hypothetical protein
MTCCYNWWLTLVWELLLVLLLLLYHQVASSQEAAVSAWSAASVDLSELLPSFVKEDEAEAKAEVSKLLQKYDAQYLAQEGS